MSYCQADSPLGRFVAEDNPELDERIGTMDEYDAVCEICEHYGVEKPEFTDLVGLSQALILRDIKGKLILPKKTLTLKKGR